MNKITLINIEYLRPKRSIETYELSSKEEKEICYVYNFEDRYFRYFKTIKSLFYYLKERIEPKINFKEKTELIDFLRYKNIITKNQTINQLLEVEV